MLIHTYTLKYLKVFFILFFTALLSACGGGGGGINVAAPEVGDISPLPSEIEGVGGVTLTTYFQESGELVIDENAINRYYSQQYDSASRIDTPYEEFNVFDSDRDDAPSGVYRSIRNDGNGENPTFYFYGVRGAGTIASVGYVLNVGNKVSTGTEIAVTLAMDTVITVKIGDNAAEFGSNNLTLRTGYDLDVYKLSDVCPTLSTLPILCENIVTSNAYSYFIKADYAAIFARHYDNYETNHGGALDGANDGSYGVLTEYENIPQTGTAIYNIGAALGHYANLDDSTKDRVLHGTGSLEANFASKEFELNLDIDDHSGADFLNITGVKLFLDDDRNKFHNYDCTGNGACSGTFDYVGSAASFNDVTLSSSQRPDIGGSFYGPSGEEIAGGIEDSSPSTGIDDILKINFIGKKQ